MAKMRVWTPKEDKYLKECIEECSTLTAAFEKASKKVKRSPKAVSQHYYVKKHIAERYNRKTVLTMYNADDDKSLLSGFIAILRDVFTFKKH